MNNYYHAKIIILLNVCVLENISMLNLYTFETRFSIRYNRNRSRINRARYDGEGNTPGYGL